MTGDKKPFEIITQSGQKISQLNLRLMSKIAKDRVIEPFEGKKSLESMQNNRLKLDEKTNKIKEKGKKAGKWIGESAFVAGSKSMIKERLNDLKDTKSNGLIKSLKDKIEVATEDLRLTAKKKYRDLEEKTKDISIGYLQKGLEFILSEDTEEWILKRVRLALPGNEIQQIQQIRELDKQERDLLVEKLYPYDAPLIAEHAKTFDTIINVALGTVVASNLPGTGLAISFINMGKTLIKIANRLKIMSGIHGRKIENPNALFKVSGLILKSLADWESNPEHIPLNPEILEELYQPVQTKDNKSLKELLGEIVKKDAYIAIPGVGMISLGKINLDDIMLDESIKSLALNYFAGKRLFEQFGKSEVMTYIDDLKEIYGEFKVQRLIQSRRDQMGDQAGKPKSQKLKDSLKRFVGVEESLEGIIEDMDLFAIEILLEVYPVHKNKKSSLIKETIQKKLLE